MSSPKINIEYSVQDKIRGGTQRCLPDGAIARIAASYGRCDCNAPGYQQCLPHPSRHQPSQPGNRSTNAPSHIKMKRSARSCLRTWARHVLLVPRHFSHDATDTILKHSISARYEVATANIELLGKSGSLEAWLVRWILNHNLLAGASSRGHRPKAAGIN